jgi:hypothetical protein
MTTGVALLERLRHAGVKVAAEGDRLILDGPTEALPDHVVALVRQHKPELLRLIFARREVSTPAECGWCGVLLAPYLLDLAGHPALFCTACKQWTLMGGAS